MFISTLEAFTELASSLCEVDLMEAGGEKPLELPPRMKNLPTIAGHRK